MNRAGLYTGDVGGDPAALTAVDVKAPTTFVVIPPAKGRVGASAASCSSSSRMFHTSSRQSGAMSPPWRGGASPCVALLVSSAAVTAVAPQGSAQKRSCGMHSSTPSSAQPRYKAQMHNRHVDAPARLLEHISTNERSLQAFTSTKASGTSTYSPVCSW